MKDHNNNPRLQLCSLLSQKHEAVKRIGTRPLIEAASWRCQVRTVSEKQQQNTGTIALHGRLCSFSCIMLPIE